MVREQTSMWGTYAHTPSNAPSRAVFTHPLKFCLASFLLVHIFRLVPCESLIGEIAISNTSLQVVPNQNDFDSGPRKSHKIDLPRRAQA
jgi:hypothetical protein